MFLDSFKKHKSQDLKPTSDNLQPKTTSETNKAAQDGTVSQQMPTESINVSMIMNSIAISKESYLEYFITISVFAAICSFGLILLCVKFRNQICVKCYDKKKPPYHQDATQLKYLPQLSSAVSGSEDSLFNVVIVKDKPSSSNKTKLC